MAYFDEDNRWNSTFNAGWFEIHPDLRSTMAIEDANIMFHNVWDTAERPEPIPDPSTNVLGPCDHAVSSTTQDGCGQPSYSAQHWAEPQPESHPQPTGFLGWDASSVNPAELEACTLMPAPSSAPLHYWDESEGGSAFSTFCQQNVYTPHQLSTGPARTELGQGRRFQPYGTPRARATEHVNAEAGPSTLPPPRISSVGPPTTPPPGGLESETTADAVQNQPNGEEDKALESKQTLALRLRKWAQRWNGPGSRRPGLKDAVDTAAKVIPRIRTEIYRDPWLRARTTATATTIGVTTKAEKERMRRKAIRASCEELSKYYPRAEGEWSVDDLLEKVIWDLENHPDLKPTVRRPTPAAST